MLPEKTFTLPAASIDQPPPKEEWGTKIAQFRGVVYDLFLADLSGESYWPKGFPLVATCVVRSDTQGSHTLILDVGAPPDQAAKRTSGVHNSSGRKVA